MLFRIRSTRNLTWKIVPSCTVYGPFDGLIDVVSLSDPLQCGLFGYFCALCVDANRPEENPRVNTLLWCCDPPFVDHVAVHKVALSSFSFHNSLMV